MNIHIHIYIYIYMNMNIWSVYDFCFHVLLRETLMWCHRLHKRSSLGSFEWAWPSRSRLELLHVNALHCRRCVKNCSWLKPLSYFQFCHSAPLSFPARVTQARLQLVWLTPQCVCARWLLCVNSEGAPGRARVCVEGGCCWSSVLLHSPEASNGPWRFSVSSTPDLPALGFKDVLVEAERGFSVSPSGSFSSTDV